jgi:hypothetical protein
LAACDDRQLTEAQRQAAQQQQQRAGVMQAVRPYTGSPTLPGLVDYINRELFPAIKQTRGKVNEVFRQVTDNAPSGNPLQYFFAEATGNADPTAGRIRLDNATQSVATTIRVSELNARLASAAPWLDVMAGGATVPLGTVTLSDVSDPTRFLRFDLDTMVDQGSYWDLGVTPVESSHDNPFVEAEPIAIGFIPGVSAAGSTVPAGSLSPIAANTVLGNNTASTAAPVAIPIPTFSALGRAAANVTAVTATFAPAFLRTNAAATFGDPVTTIGWGTLVVTDLPRISDGQIYMNTFGSLKQPTARNASALAGLGLGWDATNYAFDVTGSTSIVVDSGSDSVQRAALTGDVTASQNSNATTIAANAVTDAKLRQGAATSVIGNATGSIANVADIIAGSDDLVLLRRSGTLSFQLIGNANVADGTIVATTKLAGISANTVLGNDTASAHNPIEIAVGTNSVLGRVGSNIVAAPLVTAQITDANVTDAKISNRTALSVFGRSANSSGVGADIAAANDGEILRRSGTTLGFGTVATAGLADDSVTNAKLANMAERRIKGRADSAGTGDPTDLTGAQVGAIIRFNTEIGDTTTTGSVATYTVNTNTNEVTFNGVTNVINGFTAAAEPGQLLVVQHIGAGTTTLVNQSTSASAAADRMRISTFGADVSALVLGATGRQIAVFLYFGSRWVYLAGDGPPIDAIQDAMMRNSAALSVYGRSANSSGDPADITASAASDAVLRESGSTVGFGTIATGGIANDAVTNAKLANMAARTIKGRADGAGSGDPTDLTGAQVGAIIRLGNETGDTTTTGSVASYAVGTGINIVTFNGVTNTIHGITAPAESGQLLIVRHIGSGTSTLVQDSTTATSSNDRLNLGDFAQNSSPVVLGTSQNQQGAMFIYFGSRWQRIPDAIANDVIDNSKLRNSGALSVIGRSANSSGDPADISATASSDAVLRESGSVLGFGTIATGGIAANAVTDAKLRQGAALSVIGRSANSTGNVADIAAANDGEVLRRSGTALGFGTIATAGITDAAVTLAKMADLAQSRIIGRAESAGTGVPTSLTPTQVVAIIDGENATWTGAHSFTGATHTVAPSGNVTTTGAVISTTSTSTQVLSSGADLILAASTTIDLNSPTRAQSSFALNSVLSSTETGPVDNKAIGTIQVWRFTPNSATTLLRGMVPSGVSQLVYVVNVSTVNTIQVQPEDTSNTATNRFSLDGTSFSIGPLRACGFWHDETSSRWRPLDAY